MAKILFIEDDAQLVKLYQNVLEQEGFTVTVAGTGMSGLSLAFKEKPDAIILDIMLPGGMNGFDVLEQLKRDDTLKQVPVFMLTNLDSEEKVAREIGVTDYIIKAHVDPKEVVAKIKTSLHL